MYVLSVFSSRIVMIKKNFLYLLFFWGYFFIYGLFENLGGVMYLFLIFWFNIVLDFR